LIRRRDARAFGSVVGRHDGLWIEACGVYKASTQLRLAKAPGVAQVRGEIALKAFFRKGAAVAKQAKPDLAIRDERPAPHRIAFGAGERGRDSFVGSKSLPKKKKWKDEEQYPHTISMPWFLSGTVRMRLPVAL